MKVYAGFGAWLDERPVARQFLKFCIVGGTSFLVDAGLHYLLMFVPPDRPVSVPVGEWWNGVQGGAAIGFEQAQKLASPILKVPSAGLAILNSFAWNRLWTFRIRGKEERVTQFARFVVVSLIGMLINVAVVGVMTNIVPGHPKRSWAVATLVATAAVAVWNFNGQRLWAFKRAAK